VPPLVERACTQGFASSTRRSPPRRSPTATARGLHLSEGTVPNYLSSAIGKTGARRRAEAVRLADDNGWLL